MRENVIHCPYCDWEYLPGEIFIPDNLIGQPKDIERTIEGKIDTYLGKIADTEETFVCEHCANKFKVKANISFITEKDSKYNFEEDFVSLKFPTDRLTLFEG